MADDAFASFERKWLDANPEQAAVLVFLDAEERRRATAFGTLVHELAESAFAIRETQVAAAKLSWWQHELGSAVAGRARHPVSIELFADAIARAIEPAKWIAMAEGAMSQLEQSSASDFEGLFDRYRRFYIPVAAVESELSGAREHSIDAVANLWICSRLLSIPAQHSSAAELRDVIDKVRRTLDASLAQAPHASVGRRVRARADRTLATIALQSSDPAASLATRSLRPSLRHVWWAWREARASRPRT